jgi:ribosomal-protein-alanine N-acetyltransferase
LLRRMTAQDAEDVFEYASDPMVSRFTTWSAHRSIGDSREFLDMVLDRYENYQVSSWGIEQKADGKFIGTCGFMYWLPAHARAEIGYALSRRYWNRGYMTEAVRTVIDFGFRTMGLNRIEARCRIENIPSARVMEKTGMTYEGILRGHMLAKGKFRDLKLYAILRDEWAN